MYCNSSGHVRRDFKNIGMVKPPATGHLWWLGPIEKRHIMPGSKMIDIKSKPLVSYIKCV